MKKKILVKAPALSSSGYGEQARFALRSLRENEHVFDIYLINIPWGKTGQVSENQEEISWIKTLIEKEKQYKKQMGRNTHYDISLQITIPNEFENLAVKNIGYTAGIETTKVSPHWIEKGNMMDKIIVPSKHSKTVFEQTIYKAKNQATDETIDFRLSTPVDVCSFPVKNVEPANLSLDVTTSFNFLSVAQWSVRKNVESTILNFLKEFKDEENVGLILKMNIARNSTIDKMHTTTKVRHMVDTFRENFGETKCKIYLLHGNMSESEIQGLYRNSKVKAFVTTTHGEGFGLPLFDAAKSALPILAPSWSSYVDFLNAPKKDKKTGKVKNRPHYTKIDFDLKNVQKEAVWEGVIQADSQWCFVKDQSVRSSMRDVFKNYTQKLSEAKKLSSYILENFTEEKQFSLFSDLIHKQTVDEQTWEQEIGEMNES